MSVPTSYGADRLATIAAVALSSYLDRSPVEATYLGDHNRDSLLDDPSIDAARLRAADIRTQLAQLDSLPAGTAESVADSESDRPLDVMIDTTVDAGVLRTVLTAELLELEDIREAEWNPMLYNPGAGLHALLSRDFAPLPERLRSVAGRLSAVPDYLAAGRERLSAMSRIHLDTALTQIDGTLNLLDTELPRQLGQADDLRAEVEPALTTARRALAEHRDWLAARADGATKDPRLGERLFRDKLALTLDTAFEPHSLLQRASDDLESATFAIVEQAGRIAGEAHPDTDTVRRVLDALAADAPTDETIIDLCASALAETTEFVRAHDIVTVFDDLIDIAPMPEIDRGVAVAFCRPNGPLETAPLPTEVAVSPTPAEWSAEQVSSFYRELNAHMVHNLMVHEAMPGHALQLMHANRYRGTTPIRAVWWSGSFVEGWAVYTEEVMADAGYRSATSPEAGAALRMQQLKMQLRTIINAIMDIRFHLGDLDEAAAMQLMVGRGFQEQSEAAGKWRRVQLTSTQLCTYYVGYSEVRDIARDLRALRPEWSMRQLHDAMLSHGSPPPRHLRSLVGLPGA